MNSTNTTTTGLLCLGLALVSALLWLYGPEESHATANEIITKLLSVATSAITGLGLIMARDNNKSSEDVGIKPLKAMK